MSVAARNYGLPVHHRPAGQTALLCGAGHRPEGEFPVRACCTTSLVDVTCDRCQWAIMVAAYAVEFFARDGARELLQKLAEIIQGARNVA